MWLEASFTFGELDEEHTRRRFGKRVPSDENAR